MYKRRRNDVEDSFEQMGVKASELLYRSMLIFPISIILSTPLIFKLFYSTWKWDTTYLLLISIGVGFIMHFLLTMIFFEYRVEKCMRKCALNILKEMKERGEIENVFEHKRYIRDLRNTVDGRWIKKP